MDDIDKIQEDTAVTGARFADDRCDRLENRVSELIYTINALIDSNNNLRERVRDLENAKYFKHGNNIK